LLGGCASRVSAAGAAAVSESPGGFFTRHTQGQSHLSLGGSRGIMVKVTDGASTYYSDIYSRLMSDRIVMLYGPVTEAQCALVTAQLLHLEGEDPERPVTMYINSPGGEVSAGLGIYDTMQYIKCPVHTTCVGRAASMGSLLLCAGEAGERRMLPHARVMCHQPLGGSSGQVTDMEIYVKEMMATKSTVYDIYATHTGQTASYIAQQMERDRWMSAEEARQFGLVDEVFKPRGKADGKGKADTEGGQQAHEPK